MEINVKNKDYLLFILLAVLLSIVLAIGGFSYYNLEKKEAQKRSYNELNAVADLKSNEITHWYEERLSELKYFSRNAQLKEWVKQFILSGDTANYSLIDNDIKLFASNHAYSNIFILSTDLKIKYTLDPMLNQLSWSSRHFFEKFVNEGQPILTDFNYCDIHHEVHLDFASQIVAQNQVVAILVFRINPDDYLFPMIQSWPIPSRTAESLLVREEGDSILFLNELRHKKGTAMKFRLPKDLASLPAAMAVSDKAGFFEGIDYRGEKVISDIREIEGTNWSMVAKIDKAEVFAELHKKAVMVFAVVAALIFLSISILSWLYNTRRKNIYKQLLQTKTDLLQSQMEYRTTLQSIGDAVITTDRDGKVDFLNPVAESLTGWNVMEARGKLLEDVFRIINEDTREEVENPVKKVLREGLVVGLANHTLLVSKDGQETPIADSGAPIKNEKGETTGVVLVFRDQAEERLVQDMTNLRLRLFEYLPLHSLSEVLARSLDEIEKLTGSKVSFFHFLLPDQKTLSLQAWSTRTKKEFCTASGEGLHYNIEKAGVWTECVYTRNPVIHNDYKSLPNRKGLPEGHAEVIREMVVPIIRNNTIVAIFGVGNKPSDYTQKDVEILNYLADSIWEMVLYKHKEEELAESYRKFSTLIDNLNGVVYRCLNDRHWTMEYISEAIFALSGFPASDFTGKEKDFNSIIHPGDREMVWNNIQSSLSQKLPYTLEYRIITASNEIKWVWEKGRGLFNGPELISLEGFITDISERRKAIEELENNEELLRQMGSIAQVGGWEFDALTGQGTWTDEVAKIHGLTPGDPTNVELGISFYINDSRAKIEEAISEAIELGKPYNLELEMASTTGEHKWVQTIGTPVLENGRTVKIKGSFQDITARKQAEDEIKKLNQDLEKRVVERTSQLEAANKELEAFAYSVSHDLRAPLRGINGFTQILVDDYGQKLDDEGKRVCSVIQNSTFKMGRLIDDILTFSRLGRSELRMSPIDMDALVRSVYKEITTPEERARIIIKIKSLSGAFADPVMMSQVWTNLLSNAIKFTSAVEKPVIELSCTHSENKVSFSIKDNGAGFDMKYSNKLFGVFQRLHSEKEYPGTGVGLAIVQRIIHRHDGEVWANGEVGKGAVFCFTLPLNKKV